MMLAKKVLESKSHPGAVTFTEETAASDVGQRFTRFQLAWSSLSASCALRRERQKKAE